MKLASQVFIMRTWTSASPDGDKAGPQRRQEANPGGSQVGLRITVSHGDDSGSCDDHPSCYLDSCFSSWQVLQEQVPVWLVPPRVRLGCASMFEKPQMNFSVVTWSIRHSRPSQCKDSAREGRATRKCSCTTWPKTWTWLYSLRPRCITRAGQGAPYPVTQKREHFPLFYKI